MNHGPFTLDVHPDQLAAARQRVKRVLEMLEERTPQVLRTPDQLEDWTGAGARRIKSEMRALGGQLEDADRPLKNASRALRNLTRAYRDALDELPTLNRRWHEALGDYDDAVQKAGDALERRLGKIAESDQDEATAKHANKAAGVKHQGSLDDAARDLSSAKAAVRADFAALKEDLRHETRAAGRTLSNSMVVRPSDLECKVAAGGYENKFRRRHWTVLAREQLAAKLPLTGEHHRVREWDKALGTHGLPVPTPYDPQHAAALRGELDSLLASLEGEGDEARAQAVNKWAEALDPDALSLLVVHDPKFIGALVGMPNRARYAANRLNVADAIESELARLEAYDKPIPKGEPGYADYARLIGRIQTLEGLLSGHELVADAVTRQLQKQPTQILAFEPPTYDGTTTTDDGRLQVVIGDLDTAKFIGTVVPGITNRIDNFQNTLSKARNLNQEVPGSATVAWLGYDTPEFAEMFTERVAEEAGVELAKFMNTMVRNEDAETIALPHSYGTMVAAKALQAGMRVDRVVFFGSPGLGQDIRTREDLGISDDIELYAMRAPGDFVSVTAAHGVDPADMEGITRLDTDWLGAEDVTGHSSYTNYLKGPDGTEIASDSLTNLAGVLRGLDTTPNQDGAYLVTGGNPLEEDGLFGRYNDELRRLVALLNRTVPAEDVADFVQILEPRALDFSEAGMKPGMDDAAEMTALLFKAANEAGLDVSPEQFGAILIASGFTAEAGDHAGDKLRQWFAEQDGLDDVRIPVVTRFGTFHLDVPDQTNELAGAMAGFFTKHATTTLANMAVMGITIPAGRLVRVVKRVNTGVNVIKYSAEAARAVPGLVEAGAHRVAEGAEDVAEAAGRSRLNPRNWSWP